jgi:hypothetical protein
MTATTRAGYRRDVPVSDYHRRRWDEPRVVVEVPVDGAPCCGELEARRRKGDEWEAWVRCTDELQSTADTCSGWFRWGEVAVIEVEDVSGRSPRETRTS